jgi:hypothetical protein
MCRPEVVINFNRDFWSIGQRISGAGLGVDGLGRPPSLNAADWEALDLTDRGRKLLGHARPSDAPRL